MVYLAADQHQGANKKAPFRGPLSFIVISF